MNNIAIDGGKGLCVDKKRIGDWSETWTGKLFYHQDPRPEEVDILDILHALSNISRYTGHSRFYSVAEHSVLVSQLVPEEHALTALCHDFCEAYVMDMSRPLKRALGSANKYFEIEQNIWEKAIAPKFGLPNHFPQCVLDADTQIMVLEKAALLPRSHDWFLPFPMPKGIKLNCHKPESALIRIVRRYCNLTGEDASILFDRYFDLIAEDESAFVTFHNPL